MKLSGSFSEFGHDRVETTSAEAIVERMWPWLDHVFTCFGPERIMFGSDWPVCNVRGPAMEDSWIVWQRVVQTALQRRSLSEDQMIWVWRRTAIEAYQLNK